MNLVIENKEYVKNLNIQDSGPESDEGDDKQKGEEQVVNDGNEEEQGEHHIPDEEHEGDRGYKEFKDRLVFLR